MLLAGWRAVREYDLKLILAFGTVSQLGFIIVMVGAGGSDMMLAGLAILCAHAMFKAALFMVVGVIDHSTGTRDIRRLAWLGERSRPLLIIAVGATASMAALPPFLGFVAKEADFEDPRGQRVSGRMPRRSCWPGWCSARSSPPSTACGSYTAPSPRRARPSPASGWPKCTAHRRIPRRARDSGRGGPALRSVAVGAGQRLDAYADTVPGDRRLRARAVARRQPAAAAVGARPGRGHRRVLRQVPVAARQNRAATSPLEMPTASTTR